MAIYSPNTIVKVDGVNFSGDTVNRVTFALGRTNVDEQPRAGVGQVTLTTYDGVIPNVNLNSRVTVQIKLSDGVTNHGVFAGYVTTINRSMRAAGAAGYATDTTLQLIGNLAKLAQKPSDATYPKQFDGDRIYDLIYNTFGDTWSGTAPGISWDDLSPTVTWATYEQGEIGEIDTPGDYEVTAYGGGVVTAQSLANLTANSALGILWEDGEGRINYDSATHRINNAANNGYTVIPSQYLSVNGLESETDANNITNDVTVVYKNNQEKTGEDLTSIGIYGRVARKWSTILENGTDAEQIKDLYLETRSLPRQNLSAVTIPLHNPELGSSLRDELIQIYNGLAVSMPDLPPSIYSQGFVGFAEGYSFDLSRQTATVTITLSDYALTAIQQTWEQVGASETWDTLSPTLTWVNAKVVA